MCIVILALTAPLGITVGLPRKVAVVIITSSYSRFYITKSYACSFQTLKKQDFKFNHVMGYALPNELN